MKDESMGQLEKLKKAVQAHEDEMTVRAAVDEGRAIGFVARGADERLWKRAGNATTVEEVMVELAEHRQLIEEHYELGHSQLSGDTDLWTMLEKQ